MKITNNTKLHDSLQCTSLHTGIMQLTDLKIGSGIKLPFYYFCNGEQTVKTLRKAFCHT